MWGESGHGAVCAPPSSTIPDYRLLSRRLIKCRADGGWSPKMVVVALLFFNWGPLNNFNNIHRTHQQNFSLINFNECCFNTACLIIQFSGVCVRILKGSMRRAIS